MHIISFIGPPGSGKSTQVRLLQETLSRTYPTEAVSVPKLIRKSPGLLPFLTETDISELDRQHDRTFQARDRGLLAPTDIDRIYFSMISRIHQSAVVISDGAPRGLEQAKMYLDHSQLRTNTFIINLHFPERTFEHSVSRQFFRQAIKDSVQEAENRLEKFKQKSEVYLTDTVQGLSLLKRSGVPVFAFNALEPPDQLHAQILQAVGTIFPIQK